MTVVYKACQDRDGKLYSHYSYPDYELEYKFGEWIYPKIESSKLFVFDSLNNTIGGLVNGQVNKVFVCY